MDLNKKQGYQAKIKRSLLNVKRKSPLNLYLKFAMLMQKSSFVVYNACQTVYNKSAKRSADRITAAKNCGRIVFAQLAPWPGQSNCTHDTRSSIHFQFLYGLHMYR